jgi:hypothetical protein
MRMDLWRIALMVMLISFNTLAQDETASEADQNKTGRAPVMREKVASRQDRSLDAVTERLEKLEEENRTQKQRIEQLEEKVKSDEEDLKIQNLEASAEGDNYDVNSIFSIYGFFDLSFYKYFTDEKNIVNLYLPTKSTFVINNVNVYLHSKMTKSLEALLELRFTFLPHGTVTEYESVAKMGDVEIRPGGEGSSCEPSENVRCSEENTSSFERVDNSIMSPTSLESYVLGGVFIERVHLTYSPFDWLNILAGRYLTPYGIWNVDHGSPVLIPTRIPYMQTGAMIPTAQTGLQIFGRFFPAPTLFLDYAVTLSNGRGPIEQYFDLDENKGVGLRLRLSYQRKRFIIAAGGYGYYGTYTNSKQTMVMEMNADGTLNRDAEYPMSARITTIDAYKEYIASMDFLLEIYGVKLQAEYIHRYVEYTKPGVRSLEEMIFLGSIFDTVYAANFQGNDVYALLAWELPLSEWLGAVTLTPYFMYEHGDPRDTEPGAAADFLQAGLNVKPSPYVTLKAEYTYVIESEESMSEDVQSISAQVAVSF